MKALICLVLFTLFLTLGAIYAVEQSLPALAHYAEATHER